MIRARFGADVSSTFALSSPLSTIGMEELDELAMSEAVVVAVLVAIEPLMIVGILNSFLGRPRERLNIGPGLILVMLFEDSGSSGLTTALVVVMVEPM